MDLTDEQWSIIQPLIPDSPRRPDRRGGRPWKDVRDIMNGILWILLLRTGAPWHDLPERYPPYQTWDRRFQQWVRSGVFEQILHALATDLHERGGLDLSECFIDGTFIVAKKGRGNEIGEATKRGKGTKKVMAISDSSLVVFLLPYTLRLLLHRMKSPLLGQLSPSVLSLLLTKNGTPYGRQGVRQRST